MILKSRSGYETQWYFNPADAELAATALKAVGARKRRTRTLSEDQKQALAVRLATARGLLSDLRQHKRLLHAPRKTACKE